MSVLPCKRAVGGSAQRHCFLGSQHTDSQYTQQQERCRKRRGYGPRCLAALWSLQVGTGGSISIVPRPALGLSVTVAALAAVPRRLLRRPSLAAVRLLWDTGDLVLFSIHYSASASPSRSPALLCSRASTLPTEPRRSRPSSPPVFSCPHMTVTGRCRLKRLLRFVSAHRQRSTGVTGRHQTVVDAPPAPRPCQRSPAQA